MDFINNEKGQKKMVTDPAVGPGPDGGGNWANGRQGGFKMDDQNVNITFGEQQNTTREAKEVPEWIKQSTVTGEGKFIFVAINFYILSNILQKLGTTCRVLVLVQVWEWSRMTWTWTRRLQMMKSQIFC